MFCLWVKVTLTLEKLTWISMWTFLLRYCTNTHNYVAQIERLHYGTITTFLRKGFCMSMRDYVGTRARFYRKWRHVNISTLKKWMYHTSTIWNLLNLLRAFFHKWLKWRRYHSLLIFLPSKLTLPDWCRVHAIFFARNPNFVNKLRL